MINQSIRILYLRTVYEVKVAVIIDHIVKSKTIEDNSPVNVNHVSSMINRQVKEFPPILLEWLQTKMTWNDIKAEVKLIRGEPIEITDWTKIKINLCTSHKAKRGILTWKT